MIKSNKKVLYCSYLRSVLRSDIWKWCHCSGHHARDVSKHIEASSDWSTRERCIKT